jgi:hypothetical protein
MSLARHIQKLDRFNRRYSARLCCSNWLALVVSITALAKTIPDFRRAPSTAVVRTFLS